MVEAVASIQQSERRAIQYPVEEEINQHTHIPSSPTSSPSPSPLADPSFMTNKASFSSMFFDKIQPSRFRDDFTTISFLGKGGFGGVWKCLNRMDQMNYAVKKISLHRLGSGSGNDHTQDFDKVMREVKFQARLNHANVVRYYSAWLEHHDPTSSGPPASMEHTMSASSSFLVDEENDGGDEVENDGEDDESLRELSHSIIQEASVGAPSNITNPFRAKKSLRFFNSLSSSSSSSSSVSESLPTDNSSKIFKMDGTSADSSNSRSANQQQQLVILNSNVSNGHHLPTSSSPSTSLPSPTRHLVLHIQMELCDFTLEDWINARNASRVAVDEMEILRIFRDISKGLAYVHDNGCIHRDIKPKNIYWKSDVELLDPKMGVLDAVRFGWKMGGRWLVGDFGLVTTTATTAAAANNTNSSGDKLANNNASATNSTGSSDLSDSDHPEINLSTSPMTFLSNAIISSSSLSESERTEGVGTYTYAAPEQLAGYQSSTSSIFSSSSSSMSYSDKADMYSMGIILFELLYPFSTSMERIKALSLLREAGVFASESFVKQWPKEATLILWLMEEEPAKRPSARQLVEQFELLQQASSNGGGGGSEGVGRDSDTIIRELREENSRLKERIAELEARLLN